jgi:hypothetical protein
MSTATQQSDFKEKNLADKLPTDKFEKAEQLAMNILFSIMLVLTGLGSVLLASTLRDFLENLSEYNKDYTLPEFSDFCITLISTPLLIVNFS